MSNKVQQRFYRNWCEAVGELLGLTSYLFGNQPGDESYERKPFFPVRIACLLLLAWCTMLILITILFIVPRKCKYEIGFNTCSVCG